MSLALTALRLGTVAALNSHPVIAGICQGRVYDSMIGDFDHREPVPVITVATEELDGTAWSDNNGGAPFGDTASLVLEIAMAEIGEADGEPAISAPATDRELEAVLNLLAESTETMLSCGRAHPLDAQPTPEGRLLLERVIRRIPKRTITRFTTDRSDTRLAIHQVTFVVELQNEELDALDTPDGPYAVLPDPLRSICRASREGSSERLVCDLIAARLSSPTIIPLQSAAIAPMSGALPVRADFPTLDPPNGPIFDEDPICVSM